MKRLLTCFAVLLALTLAVGVGVSNAGTATATSITVANTNFGGATPNALQLTIPNNAVQLQYTFGATRTAGTQTLFTINLNNAQFAAQVTGSDIALSSGTSIIYLSGGAPGQNTVTFQINGAIAAGSDIATFTVRKLQGLAALASVGTAVTATEVVKDAATQSTFDSSTSAVTLVTSASPINATIMPNSSTGVPANSNVVDVNQGFKFFASSDPNVASGQALVNLGSVIISAFSGVKDLNGSDIVLSSGDSAVLTLNATGGSFSSAGAVFLSLSNNLTTAPTSPFAQASVAPASATFNLTGAQLVSSANQPLSIYMLVNGTTPIDLTTSTASLSLTIPPATTSVPFKAGPVSLMTLVKNGTSRFAFSIPKPNSADGFALIRITNTSAVAGAVFGTLYFDDGSSTPLINLSASLPGGVLAPNATVTVTTNPSGPASQIQLGFLPGVPATWPTPKARISIDAAVPTLQVQALLRNPATGATTNLGAMAIGVE